MEGEVGVESNAPFAFDRSSDVPSIQQRETIGISVRTYNVVEVMPDGEGMTELRLRNQILCLQKSPNEVSN